MRLSGRKAGKNRSRGLFVPDAVRSRAYFASLVGPLFVSAALGVQAVLTAVLFVEPPEAPDDLTRWGEFLFIPDLDVVIFLAGVIATACLSAGLGWAWNRRLRSVVPSDRFLIGSLATQTGVAVGGTALFLTQFLEARTQLVEGSAMPGSFLAIVGAIGAVSAGSAVIGWPNETDVEGEGSRLQAWIERSRPEPIRRRFSLLDLVVPVAIVAVVYIPSWRLMSGRLFMEESLFHWDWFAMGPTLSFHHGGALGLDVYAMYGVGWPMFFNAIDPWIPISYGRMIQIGSLYACMYLTGIYLLLRLLVRHPGFAAFGTVLAVGQLFLAMGDVVIWRFPSYTPMRWAFDIWCFIALVLHWRSERRVWAVAAGLAIGFALLFSTDTGLYLAAAVSFYWLSTLTIAMRRPRYLQDAALSVAVAGTLLLTGLAIASRGTLLTPEFWRGWLEPLLEFGSGFAQLPLATVPNSTTIVAFAVVFFSYLVVVGYALNKLVHCRAYYFDLFNGFIAFYGLLSLNHFIGRSGDYTPFRLYVPLAIIAVALAGKVYGHAGEYVRRGSGRTGAVTAGSYAVVLALAVALFTLTPRTILIEPIFQYPNLVSSQVGGGSSEDPCLFLEPKDLCGLDPELEETATRVRAIAAELENLTRAGERVAVIDESGSLFYLASDTAPWERYPRVFVVLTTLRKLEEVKNSIEQRPPDYILTRQPVQPNADLYDTWPFMSFGLGPNPESTYSDTWEGLLSVVRENYRLVAEREPFELWKLTRRVSP